MTPRTPSPEHVARRMTLVLDVVQMPDRLLRQSGAIRCINNAADRGDAMCASLMTLVALVRLDEATRWKTRLAAHVAQANEETTT